MDEKEAYAIAYANLKGSKDKDIPATAQALRFIKDLHGNESNTKLGENFDVSGEIVGEFLGYFKLAQAIQQLFEEKKLTQLEQVRRLAQLKRKYPDALEILIDAAKELAGLKSHETRYVIEYVLHHPQIRPKEAREIIAQSKTVTTQEYYLTILLSEEEYKVLSKESRKSKLSESKLASSVVKDWLKLRSLEP